MSPIHLLSLLLLAAPALAHQHRHHDAHVHGEASVDLAVDGVDVELQLTAPGIGILDFERPPNNATEQASLASALAILSSGKWAVTPASAGCRTLQAEGRAEGFEVLPPLSSTEPTATPQSHAGFSATLRLRCKAPAALTWLEVRLPSQFPGLHQVVVNALGPQGQSRSVLTARQQRVELAQ